MSSSTQPPKFLLDENVHLSLYKYLNGKGVDVKLVPKSASDEQVAVISKREKRVLVTNDEDFCSYDSDELYCVIWLRVPQGDIDTLLSSFGGLIESMKSFMGKLVVLKAKDWDEFELGKEFE